MVIFRWFVYLVSTRRILSMRNGQRNMLERESDHLIDLAASMFATSHHTKGSLRRMTSESVNVSEDQHLAYDM